MALDAPLGIPRTEEFPAGYGGEGEAEPELVGVRMPLPAEEKLPMGLAGVADWLVDV